MYNVYIFEGIITEYPMKIVLILFLDSWGAFVIY